MNESDLKFFADKTSSLILRINIPLGMEAVQAHAHPAWMRCLKEGLINQYVVGLAYEEIENRGNQRILRYVVVRKFFKALAIAFSIMLKPGLRMGPDSIMAACVLKMKNSFLVSRITWCGRKICWKAVIP